MKNIVNEISVEDILDSRPSSSHRKITAEWNGHAWCLCHGEWTIKIDGQKVDLPEEVATENMNTFGTYSRWYFNSNWGEEWESYQDGLHFSEWLEHNRWWVDDLFLSPVEQQDLFDAISEQDWCHGSCGGCI